MEISKDIYFDHLALFFSAHFEKKLVREN